MAEVSSARRRAGRIVLAVLGVGAVAAIVWLGFDLHAGAARSSYTQDHGVARGGVVTSVTEVDHSSKYDSWVTYDYGVRLDSPVDGTDETVAHDPAEDYQRYDTGDRIDVLVDPKDTGYAELPGERVNASTWWLGPGILLVVFVGLAVLIWREGRKRRQRSPEELVRSLRKKGRLAEAAAHVDELGPYGVAGDDADTSLGASVLEEYGDQLAANDWEAADAAYQRAADLQRRFASTATAGGEGIARMDIAARIDAKRYRR